MAGLSAVPDLHGAADPQGPAEAGHAVADPDLPTAPWAEQVRRLETISFLVLGSAQRPGWCMCGAPARPETPQMGQTCYLPTISADFRVKRVKATQRAFLTGQSGAQDAMARPIPSPQER